MAIARVNVGIVRAWGTTPTATQTTAATSLTAGNTLIVAIGAQDVAAGSATVTGVTDTAGNTYTKVDHAYQSTDFRVELWYAKNVTGHATNQVTVTFTGNVTYRGVVATQYSGLDATAPLDTSAKANQAPASGITSSTLTTTTADEVHILVARFGVTPTYPAGFSDLGGDLPYLQVQEKIVSATMSGTYSTSGGSFQTVILVGAFKAAAALARVQATPKGTSATSLTNSVTFATPPTIGNGIVVPVNIWNVTVSTVTDNYGNTYTRAAQKLGTPTSEIWYCSAITATGASFTITVTLSTTNWSVAIAIEVSGVGTGLSVDQFSTAGTTGAIAGSTVTVGPTAALTANNVFVAALLGLASLQSAITVETVTPAWTEEFEELTTAYVGGEADSRVLTTASGATTSATWTLGTGGTWSGALVAFRAGVVASSTAARVSQQVAETLSQPTAPAARVSQQVAELLGTSAAAFAEGRVTQLVAELLGASAPPPPETRVSQALAELLRRSDPIPLRATTLSLDVFLQIPAGAAATQLALEVFAQRAAALRASQLALETWRRINAATRLTHAAVELWRHDPAPIRATQLVVELWVILPPCIPADFPIDVVPPGGSCSAGLLP